MGFEGLAVLRNQMRQDEVKREKEARANKNALVKMVIRKENIDDPDDFVWMVPFANSRFIDGQEFVAIKKSPNEGGIHFMLRDSLLKVE